MATYTINTTPEEDNAIAFKLPFDNAQRMKALVPLPPLDNAGWVQNFFEENMQLIINQAQTAALAPIIAQLQNNPTFLAQTQSIVAQTIIAEQPVGAPSTKSLSTG